MLDGAVQFVRRSPFIYLIYYAISTLHFTLIS